MDTVRVNVNVDRDTKEAAEKLYKELGLNMSTAVNMFLKRSILERGIPFPVDLHVPNDETLSAMEEGQKILSYSDRKRYDDLDELWRALA